MNIPATASLAFYDNISKYIKGMLLLQYTFDHSSATFKHMPCILTLQQFQIIVQKTVLSCGNINPIMPCV